MGLSAAFIDRRILPAVALSIAGGNVFYAFQAHRLAQRSGRNDVTAIPFGVNLPTIFAYVFLIMVPVYQHTHDAHLAWQAGVFASFASGIVQTLGAFCTDWLRRNTPRAALLCPLAGIALAYLSLGFIFGIFKKPEIALFPTVILFVVYASRLRLPFRIPVGLLCLVTGALLAVALRAMHLYGPPALSPPQIGLYLPQPVNILTFLLHSGGWHYLAIILPMSMLDTLVSLQILGKRQVRRRRFSHQVFAPHQRRGHADSCIFRQPVPTTLYFGHMAHKDFGARTGYSILSGLTIAILCMTGLVSAVLQFVPLEVVSIVVVWFGLVMVGQAFQEVPRSHCVAVAFGLLPMLAAWALSLVALTITKSGATLLNVASLFGSELPIYGVIALSQGAILVSMVWAAALAWTFDRRFLKAALWMAAASLLSFVGLIHAYTLTATGVENKLGFFAAPAFALGYAAAALFLVACHLSVSKARAPWLSTEMDR